MARCPLAEGFSATTTVAELDPLPSSMWFEAQRSLALGIAESADLGGVHTELGR